MAESKEALNAFLEDLTKFHLNQINKYEVLTDEKEKKLLRAYKEDNDVAARDQLIKSNLRYVVQEAKKFQGRGLPLLDLIQEGSIGLMEAINNFDIENHDTKLLSYANHHIKRNIRNAIKNNSAAHYTPYFYNKVSKYIRTQNELIQKEGRTPTDDEITQASGLKQKDLAAITNLQKGAVYLDTPASDDDETTIGELILADQDSNIDNDIIQKEILNTIKNNLDKLPAKEKAIIQRYNLSKNNVKTLEEIAKVYGISPETARQIEIKALSKLRKDVTDNKNSNNT